MPTSISKDTTKKVVSTKKLPIITTVRSGGQSSADNTTKSSSTSLKGRYVTRSGKKLVRFFDKDGERISDKELVAYYKSIGVPPAWREVKIATSKTAKILAVGIDAADRKQYVYNPTFRAKQEAAKFERILSFARALPRMRQIVDKDLQRQKLDYKKVMATIISILDRTYIRIGNDTYARSNQSYGLTTLRSKHTTVKGDTVTFDFIGKSGKHHVQNITERKLARIVRQLDNLPGYEVFKYYGDDGKLRDVKSSDVNAYIKDGMGDNFSAKDFRTWAGTLLASGELAIVERSDSERDRKKAVTACVKKVAKKLGNTPAVARSSYIDPRIIQIYMDGDDLRAIRSTVEKMQRNDNQHVSPDERCVLNVLEKTT